MFTKRPWQIREFINYEYCLKIDHLCGLAVRIAGYRSRGPGLERGPQPREYNWGAACKKK
jgi:hypothetical protein